MKQRFVGLYPILLVVGLFLCLIGSKVFSEGMFFDGIIYAAIARNMAEGMGSFWSPYFAAEAFPQFYEHPPLGFGLEALWFKLIGDHFYVERIYTLFNILLSVYLTARLWILLTQKPKYAYWPVLFFLMNGAVIWAAPNNMLESTMLNFLLLSAFFYCQGALNKNRVYVALAGLCITLGFLTKGPTALYLWAFPFWYFLIFKNKSLGFALGQSVLLFISSLVPILLLFLIQHDSYLFLEEYMQQQIIRSVTSVQTVSTRFFIFFDFIANNALGILVAMVLLLIAYKNNKLQRPDRLAFVFMLTALGGVLPVMISLKQSGHYILTVYPFFAIGISLLILPYVLDFKISKKVLILGKVVTLAVCALAVYILSINAGKINRDHKYVQLVYEIRKKNLGIEKMYSPPDLIQDYNLNNYLMRYNKVSLVTDSVATYKIFTAERKALASETVMLRTEAFYITQDRM